MRSFSKSSSLDNPGRAPEARGQVRLGSLVRRGTGTLALLAPQAEAPELVWPFGWRQPRATVLDCDRPAVARASFRSQVCPNHCAERGGPLAPSCRGVTVAHPFVAEKVIRSAAVSS